MMGWECSCVFVTVELVFSVSNSPLVHKLAQEKYKDDLSNTAYSFLFDITYLVTLPGFVYSLTVSFGDPEGLSKV
jgi:hypothetical protein